MEDGEHPELDFDPLDCTKLAYREFEDWERDELIANLGDALVQCNEDIRNRMIGCFTQADPDYGRRVKEAIEERERRRPGKNRDAEVSNELGQSADPC
jgi:catalase